MQTEECGEGYLHEPLIGRTFFRLGVNIELKPPGLASLHWRYAHWMDFSGSWKGPGQVGNIVPMASDPTPGENVCCFFQLQS